jgi:hypothetical protein
MIEYDTLFKEIHNEYNTRVFHDDTTERKVLLARKYSFWLIHETIIKYAILKEQITAYKNKAKMEINQLDQPDQTEIQSMVTIYQLKHETYSNTK